MRLLILISVLCFIYHAHAWRIFHNGRSVGGNLGIPPLHQFSSNDIPEQWFTQLLDHFDPINENEWKQRYFVNEEFYDPNVGGPIFLMIGGEGEASVEWMTQGAWITYAKKFGALCFQLEHRYYGKSHPTSDLSVKNLIYLSSEQALADLASFIVAMNKKYGLSDDQKWIAFGGSYPGSLAAWLRLKYPHLVHGAMSASGPLLAESDFRDYFKVVADSIETYSDHCLDIIADSTRQIDILLSTLDGQKNITRLFHLCDPVEDNVKNSKDVSNLFATLADNFAGVVQYNKDNRVGKSSKMNNITIDTLCNIITGGGKSTIESLADVNRFMLTLTDQKCLDYKYNTMIDAMRSTGWDSEVAEGGRQWTYQTCTEFGFYQTSSYSPPIFGNHFPLDFFIDQCKDIFGPRYNESLLYNSIDRTNMIYGALGIQVSNVVFVHGSIDPWHALGVTKTIEQGAPAIFIQGTAHCANMYPERDSDLPQLKAARVQIEQLIDTWIRL